MVQVVPDKTEQYELSEVTRQDLKTTNVISVITCASIVKFCPILFLWPVGPSL